MLRLAHMDLVDDYIKGQMVRLRRVYGYGFFPRSRWRGCGGFVRGWRFLAAGRCRGTGFLMGLLHYALRVMAFSHRHASVNI